MNYDFLEYSSTGSGSNAVFFQYEVADFAFGTSYDTDASQGADRWDVSATYTYDNVSATLIYGQAKSVNGDNDQDLVVLALGAELSDFNGTLFVGRDGDTLNNSAGERTDGTAYGLSLAYNVGAATTLTAAYGDGSADGDTQQYGFDVLYELGGGSFAARRCRARKGWPSGPRPSPCRLRRSFRLLY